MKGHDIDNLWFFGIVVAVAIPLIPVSVHYAKKRPRSSPNWHSKLVSNFSGAN